MVGASVIPKDGAENVEAQYILRENRIKAQESTAIGYVIGVFGACYMMRGESYQSLPANFITDDLYQTMSVVRQGIVHDFLQKDIESYGILSLTKKAKEFLKKPYEIQFTKDVDFETVDDEEDLVMAGAGKGGGLDDTLLNILKDLRRKIGKQKNVPPFVVFQDPSLDDMAINYPITMEEMKNIQGVGQGKAMRFGQEFVDVIARYVEDNDIIRPMDMVVKSIVNKSTNKVYIIQNIDRKLDLEDIAKAKGMSMNDLLSELESIVSSGTKINIDYYIDEEIDEDKQDEVFDYFRSAETDSIDAAMKELGEEDYTEEEIRLMRIKFISELGN
jgi:ATP-dependent DNA helicase RecQ